MKRENRLEEALEIIYDYYIQKGEDLKSIKEMIAKDIDDEVIDDLSTNGLISTDGENLILTEEGEEIAKDIARRHRLTERLLVDVLEQRSMEDIHTTACEFEHIISKDVEESICTLLGHPRECPHGSEIPIGDCCKRAELKLESIIQSLDKFSPGESGRVSYILTSTNPQMHKLMSFGIAPGVKITVHQVSPSYVIQIGETQLAIEKNIAKNIYLRKSSSTSG